MTKRKLSRCAAAGCAALVSVAASPLSLLPVSAASGIVINEVCTKNDVKAAPDGQFYDYVELYNPTGSAISVAGFGLTDDIAEPMRYTLPADAVVPAHGYYTIYCGIDETSGVAGATFGLAKRGETITLSNAQGIAEETIEVPALNDNTAYGRMPDGSQTFAVLSSLTPGSANPTDQTVKIAVEAPQFSQESGFYNSSFNLSISAPQGCTVYYTLDGSDPTTASPQATGSIQIYDKSSEPNVYAAKTDVSDGYVPPTEPVDKAMIVRAIAVDASGNQSDIITKTYFIGYTQNDCEMNMRVISLVTDPDNLFDYEKGIYVKGKIYDESPGNMMQSWSHPANYTQSGKEWERPANITVFEKGTATYNANVGIRMHGAATRADTQKSFNLYARTDYGTPKLEYDFFNGQLTNHKGEIIDSFDKLTLRNGGNDYKTKIRDRLNQEMVSDRHYGTQAQTECVVFLDGEFWGTYNIVEKIGKEYISDHYKVKQSTVCMIKTDELSDGSQQGWNDYEQLKNLANSTNYRESGAYNKFAELIDMKSFAEYMATELILGNSDFGDNNYSLWKTEVIDEDKKYADGKWRFLLFDTEYGQGLYGQSNANTNAYQNLRMKSNSWIIKLFNGLSETPEFRNLFLTAYFDLCNEYYKTDEILARLNQLEQIYKPSMIKSYSRFGWTSDGGGWNMGDWNPGDWQIPGGGDWQNPNPGDGQNPGGGDWQIPGGGDWQIPGGGDWQIPGGDQPGGPVQDNTTPEEKFTSAVETIRTFWSSHMAAAQQHTLQNFNTNETVNVTVQNNASQGHIKFNTLKLYCENGSWSGVYPKECTLTLEAKPVDGYHLEKWVVSGAEFVSGSATSAEAQIKPNGQTVSVQAVYAVGDPNPSDPPVDNPPNITVTKRGDVNCDDTVDVSDAVLLARYLAEDNEASVSLQGQTNADVNGSGKPDMGDITIILKMIAKLV